MPTVTQGLIVSATANAAEKAGRIELVTIFKPTLDCNLKCPHCYIGDSPDSHHRMPLETAISILNKIPRQSEIIFHGGEPSLMGTDYYLGIAGHFSDAFKYSMQTNMLKIDEKWLPVVKDVLFGSISTSFEVGAKLHAFDETIWLNNIYRLKDEGVNPYVVSMLWKDNEAAPIAIYDFFSTHKLSFRLNAISKLGSAGGNSYSSIRHTDGKYADAIIAIFDKWFMNRRANINVDPCSEILSAFLLGSSAKKCPFTSGCTVHICCVHPNGDVFSCTGVDESFRYGNLIAQSYDDVFSSVNYCKATDRYFLLPDKCQTCDFFTICEGGCRIDAFGAYGDMNRETSLCPEYMRIFSHVRDRISSERGDVHDWWLSLLDSLAPDNNVTV